MSSHSLFRRRAVELAAAGDSQGDLLRLSPEWTRWAYWVVIFGIVLGVAYVTFARASEWAEGQAIVHVQGATEITSKTAGTVADVLVQPGEDVKKGTLLLALTGDEERAQLQRLEQEFKLQLSRTLRDPGDQAARQSLVTLRVERELARSRLDELSIYAAADGTIEDVRVREGQAVIPGDHLLTLSGDETSCEVWSLMPARYRPELNEGAEIGFSVFGFRYAQVKAELASVGSQAIGPREVRRYLGSDIGDAIQIEGPAVIAKAKIPSCSFESDGDSFRFHRGMSGLSSIQLRREPLWAVLFPELRKVFRGLDE